MDTRNFIMFHLKGVCILLFSFLINAVELLQTHAQWSNEEESEPVYKDMTDDNVVPEWHACPVYVVHIALYIHRDAPQVICR